MSTNKKNNLYKFLCTILLIVLFFQPQSTFAEAESPEGLEYDIRLVADAPLDRIIRRNLDLYELYFENKSSKTYSIPGYSIDLGINYLTLEDVNSIYKDKASKKLTVFNIAAGAASIALGGIVRSAANTAIRTVSSFKNKKNNLSEENIFLSPLKTYILYPGYGLSLFLFVERALNEAPNSIRFVCHEEDTNLNHIVIKDHALMKNLNANDTYKKRTTQDSPENIIAVPSIEQYK